MSQRDKVILASVMAANTNPGWLTSDRVEALTGGHGMLNIPAVAACRSAFRQATASWDRRRA